jgi:hypothetical protein
MSKASRPLRRRKKTAPAAASPTLTVADFLRRRLMNPDRLHSEECASEGTAYCGCPPRSPAEFLHDMRAKQAAGQLVNPATAALLDRLERAVG